MNVFVTGGTGYLGRALIPALLARGHQVRALTRAGSEGRVRPGAEVVVGNPLVAETYRAALRPGDTLVHLVGTPHPSPAKAAEFISVDLGSTLAAVDGAKAIGISHMVYLSVAQPMPVLKSYADARAEGERAIGEAGLCATILRPFYVIGPGHYWPLLITPVYLLASFVPSLTESARRLGLVSLRQMTVALVFAVEHPPSEGARIVDVSGIRAGNSEQ